VSETQAQDGVLYVVEVKTIDGKWIPAAFGCAASATLTEAKYLQHGTYGETRIAVYARKEAP